MRVPGFWKEGYVLDYHTRSSDFIGYDQFGRPMFQTVRTDVGELLYRLKYKGQMSALDDLTAVSVDFLRQWSPPWTSSFLFHPAERERSSQS